MSITYQDLEQVIENNRMVKVVVEYEQGGQSNHRLAKSICGDFMFMIKGRRRTGTRITVYDLDRIKSIRKINNKINLKLKWEKQIKRLIHILNDSGLWQHWKKYAEIALDIGYDNMKKAHELSWQHFEDLSYGQQELKRAENVKQIDSRLVGTNEEGKTYMVNEIIWNFSHIPKIKKMYFGKYQNESILNEISNAIDNNKEYNTGTIRAGYDVSFSYNPESKKAWYSEEFKDCGNGHYYLALSKTHAIHYEDD
jgi:hypothetical protein